MKTHHPAGTPVQQVALVCVVKTKIRNRKKTNKKVPSPNRLIAFYRRK